MLGHKTSLRKFNTIEIISSSFSDHKTMILEINYKKRTAENTSTWRLNNMQLNQWITEEIKEETKTYLDTNKNENNSKPMGHSKSSSKR